MNKPDHRIIIIIPYFGKLPWYFNYFVHSCRYNPQVDFLIITDDHSYDDRLPANIHLVHQTFEELKETIAEKLGMQVALPNTYKLCDFKPAYGLIFSEYISDYSFWGMGDVDVIYGNIRGFITSEILDNHDIITVRHDFLVGYFTLYRNCPQMNELFRQSRDHIKVFTSETHYCFDECNFAFWKLDHDISFEDVAHECEIESMTHVVKKLQRENKLRAYFDTHAIEGVYGKMVWEKGSLVFKREFEVLLYHLIILKKIYTRNYPKKIPDRFHISPTRIYHR
jgi:hypothetical protein